MKISNIKVIDKVTVSNLYSLSQRSIIATIFLSTLLTYYLYSMLSNLIILWNIAMICISLIRLYFAHLLLNHFEKEFLGILAKYELDTADIMIEITERSIIDNFEDTQDVINTLRKEGVKCAIDDFGIGYSSLSYLKKLSFDTLKIDMEFIKDIKHRPDDIILVKTILDIGKQFNYHIVVEGIEDEQQKELLLDIDKDLVYQGYLFSKPVPAEVFTLKFLK